MGLPNVSITTGASGPSSFPEIEKVALFVGKVTSGAGALNPIGPTTDLIGLFGSALDLVNTIEDARANGGANWKAWAIGYSGSDDWTDVIDAGLNGCQPEMIVVCTPVTAKADLTAMQTKAVALEALHRPLFFIASYAGINPSTQTWSQYLTAAAAILSGLDAGRCMATPQLLGHELGAFAGRLAKEKVSRSPARVRSGSVVNPGDKPVDSAGAELTLATLEALDTDRYSVFMWFEGKEGIYFADANTLEATGGDFPVVEWLRVTDKAARQCRLQAISMIADDNADNTPQGLAALNAFIARPLRGMENAREIEKLAKNAVVSEFTSITALSISITVRPRFAPKDIDIGITLDTSAP